VWVYEGCGGHKLSDIEDDQKAWIASAASHFGYGRVTVESADSLLWEYVRNKDGRTHDHVRLRNDQLDRCNKLRNATAQPHGADAAGDGEDGVVGELLMQQQGDGRPDAGGLVGQGASLDHLIGESEGGVLDDREDRGIDDEVAGDEAGAGGAEGDEEDEETDMDEEEDADVDGTQSLIRDGRVLPVASS
jgi:hypothetical protein